MFPNVPHFKELRDNDLCEADRKSGCKDMDSSSVKIPLKQFEKTIEKYKDKENKKRQRRKGRKKDPNIKSIREHLRKIVSFHKNQVDESIPSIYPILGPANSDSDSSDDEEKRLHTKQELKRY